MKTKNPGIDYSLGINNTNRDPKTGIRYGVINQNSVGEAWFDSAEPDYPEIEIECPECKRIVTAKDCTNEDSDDVGLLVCPCGFDLEREFDRAADYQECSGFILDDGEYKAECGEDGDIFVLESPYFTYAQFCSLCAPGACHLENPLDEEHLNNRAYCFGHDWFEGNKAPYKVYSVETGEEVKPDEPDQPEPTNRFHWATAEGGSACGFRSSYNFQITVEVSRVTCPKCLEIVVQTEKEIEDEFRLPR